MMDKKQYSSPPIMGVSSLLVIFAVLCLTALSLLSLSTVRANEKIASSAAAAVTDYYAADCQAQEILSLLRSGEKPEGVTEENGIFAYACPISDTQTLYIRVAVRDGDYTILRWQAAPTGLWQADDTLPVWDGETH